MHPFSRLLKKELVTALGCTEPIAIALAASKAREVLGALPKKVTLNLSGNIIKNVKGVTVPNTKGMMGVEASAVIGIIGGDPSLELEVLSKVNGDHIEKTKEYLRKYPVDVNLAEGLENLYINVVLEDDAGNSSEVVIKNEHNNFTKIVKNGEIILDKKDESFLNTEDYYKDMSVKSIFDYTKEVDLNEIGDLISNQLKVNEEISKEGLNGSWGVNIGKILHLEEDSLKSKVKALAAAGSDARMSGCSMPVVINSGSGNQGITCSMPVLVYAREKNKSQEDLVRATILSNLIALHIKRYIGRLSAFCGVVSAGVASGAGIAYLETKDFNIVEKTIGNALMIASGIICDGAKPSCAAKIATGVDAGFTGFTMAMKDKNFKAGEGLLKEDIEDTIRSIGYVAKEGMKKTDVDILNIMINKK